jgi:hypothetical protein
MPPLPGSDSWRLGRGFLRGYYSRWGFWIWRNRDWRGLGWVRRLLSEFELRIFLFAKINFDFDSNGILNGIRG